MPRSSATASADTISISLEAVGAAVEAEWRALEGCADASFFTSWAWIGTWLATLPREFRPSLLRARRDGATVALGLAGASPHRRGGFSRPGLFLNATGTPSWDRITIEHNGLLCACGGEAEIMAVLVRWFTAAMPAAHELHLDGVMNPVADGLLAASGLTTETRIVPGFLVELDRVRAAGSNLVPWLGSATRQRLRRALRDYGGENTLVVTEARSVDEAMEFFAAMKPLHVASWERRGKRHAFAEPYFEVFHRALIGRAFGEGGVQLLRVAAGGEAIGYLYNFRYRGRISAYQSGFADRDRNLSPGLVSHYLALRHNAAAGARVYDFLAGENRLKTSFATARYVLHWQEICKPRLTYRLEAMARSLRRRLFG